MDGLIEYVTTHQLTASVGVFVALLIIYILFKKLLQLALLLFLLFIAMCGYLYIKDPGRMSENLQETYQKAKHQTVRVVEKGKSVYGKGKAVAEKGVVFSKELKHFMKETEDSNK